MGKRISLDVAVQFAEGSAELSESAREIIAAAADKLVGLKNRIEVRGHASEAELEQDVDGWALGWARARAVGDELLQRDILEKRLRLASCSSVEEGTEPRVVEVWCEQFIFD